MRRFGRPTIECRDCHQQVTDLTKHRTPGEWGYCTRRRGGGGGLGGGRVDRGNAHLVGQRLREAAVVVAESTDYYVLLDVSSSMAGSRLAQAKQALLEIHEKLDDEDRLAVITFDDGAYFKLKPRANGQLKRQGEIEVLAERIFAKGATALYDAVWLAIEQVRDKTRRTHLAVLTDGEDNRSKHTLNEVLALVEQYLAITLDIVHITDGDDDTSSEAYTKLAAKGRGKYKKISDGEIVVEFTLSFTKLSII